MSEEQHDGRRAGRWVVAIGALLLAGAGFAGAGGVAVAGGDPDNAGAPGTDGENVTVTCTGYQMPVNTPFCNVVGEDGADGRTSTADR